MKKKNARAWSVESYFVHKPYTFFLVTNFSSSSASILYWVYASLQLMIIVVIVQSTSIHFLLAWSNLIFMAWVFFVLLQHYFNIGIMRILPPIFFNLSQEVNWLPWYPKSMAITLLYGMRPPKLQVHNQDPRSKLQTQQV